MITTTNWRQAAFVLSFVIPKIDLNAFPTPRTLLHPTHQLRSSISRYAPRSFLSCELGASANSEFAQPIPLSFTAMFNQYFQMGNRIRKHYLSPRVLFCLVTGRFVPPIHRKNLYSLQYSMLPATRAGIIEMWEALNSLPTKKRPVKVYPYVTNAPNGGRRMNGRRGVY